MLVFTLNVERGLRNYNLNFVIASVLNAASFVMIFIIDWNPRIVTEKPEAKRRPSEATSVVVEEVQSESVFPVDSNQNQIRPILNEDDSEDEDESKSRKNKSCFTLIQVLINWQNIRDTFHCLIKSRPGHQRAQIFFLNCIILIYFFVGFGIDAIFLQFTEKAYHWDSHTFATVSAVTKILPNVIMLLLSYVLIEKLQISDGTLLVCCIPFGVFSYALIGTILEPAVYLITIPLSKFTYCILQYDIRTIY